MAGRRKGGRRPTPAGWRARTNQRSRAGVLPRSRAIAELWGADWVGALPPFWSTGWHLVEAACPHCRHRAVIEHARLTNGRPNHMRLVDFETVSSSLSIRPAMTARLSQRPKQPVSAIRPSGRPGVAHPPSEGKNGAFPA